MNKRKTMTPRTFCSTLILFMCSLVVFASCEDKNPSGNDDITEGQTAGVDLDSVSMVSHSSDTTLREIAPRYRQLVKEKEAKDSEFFRLQEDIKKLESSLSTHRAIRKGESTSLRKLLTDIACDTGVITSKVIGSISKVGRRYQNTIEKVARDSTELTSKNARFSKVKAKRVKLEKEINELEPLLPIAALRHTGGFKGLVNRSHEYLIFIAELRQHQIQLHLVDTTQKQKIITLGNLKKMLPHAEMLTNAGMYTPSHDPEGLYLSWDADRRKYDIDLGGKKDLNFYMLPNGVFFIDTTGKPGILETKVFSDTFNSKRDAIQYATQSGPMLLINGKMHPSFNEGSSNVHIRSGVGIIDSTKVVFAISEKPVNFYDFAILFKDIFGCKNALYLDGAISQMYVKGLNEHPRYHQDFGPMISVTPKSKK